MCCCASVVRMKCFLYVMGVALVEGAAPDSAVQRMSQCNVRAARLGATRIPIVENKADWRWWNNQFWSGYKDY